MRMGMERRKMMMGDKVTSINERNPIEELV